MVIKRMIQTTDELTADKKSAREREKGERERVVFRTFQALHLPLLTCRARKVNLGGPCARGRHCFDFFFGLFACCCICRHEGKEPRKHIINLSLIPSSFRRNCRRRLWDKDTKDISSQSSSFFYNLWRLILSSIRGFLCSVLAIVRKCRGRWPERSAR